MTLDSETFTIVENLLKPQAKGMDKCISGGKRAATFGALPLWNDRAKMCYKFLKSQTRTDGFQT